MRISPNARFIHHQSITFVGERKRVRKYPFDNCDCDAHDAMQALQLVWNVEVALRRIKERNEREQEEEEAALFFRTAGLGIGMDRWMDELKFPPPLNRTCGARSVSVRSTLSCQKIRTLTSNSAAVVECPFSGTDGQRERKARIRIYRTGLKALSLWYKYMLKGVNVFFCQI